MTETAWRRMYRIEAHSRQGGLCYYCKAPMPLREATAEHLRPQSRGGKTTVKNIAAACSICNNARRNRTRAEFMRAIHEPDIANDPWPLYVACVGIRLSLAAAASCRRLRRMAQVRA